MQLKTVQYRVEIAVLVALNLLQITLLVSSVYVRNTTIFQNQLDILRTQASISVKVEAAQRDIETIRSEIEEHIARSTLKTQLELKSSTR